MKVQPNRTDRQLWMFFLITFVYSWLLWLPFVLENFNLIVLSDFNFSLMTLAVMLGAFGPLLASVVLIMRKSGWSGLKDFFTSTLSFRIKPFYYIVAFILPMLIAASAHYIVNLSGIDSLPSNLFPENLSVSPYFLLIPYFVFILLVGGGQEEFGWRGYAQEPLQQKFGILNGSIILGLVWGVWHLPLWFMSGEGHTYYPFSAFLIFTVSMSVIIGWLYNASGKKLIIPLIVHSISNVSVPFFPILHLANVPQPGYWIWVGITALVAAVMSVWYVPRFKQ